MPNRKRSNPRKALGRDPFADLDTLDLLNDDMFGTTKEPESGAAEVPETAITSEPHSAANEQIKEEISAAKFSDKPETRQDSAPLDYDSYVAQHPELLELDVPESGTQTDLTWPPKTETHEAIGTLDEIASVPGNSDLEEGNSLSGIPLEIEQLLPAIESLATESPQEANLGDAPDALKPSKTEMLDAMGIDFGILEEETSGLDAPPLHIDPADIEAVDGVTSTTRVEDKLDGIITSISRMATAESTGDDDTAEADTDELNHSDLPYENAMPGKTQMLNFMGIDFETLEDETVTLREELPPTDNSKPSKTQMLDVMGIDFGTLEEETAGLDDSNLEFEEALSPEPDFDQIDLDGLQEGTISTTGFDLETLQDETEELEAAFAAQAAFEAAMWEGIGLNAPEESEFDNHTTEDTKLDQENLLNSTDLKIQDLSEDRIVAETARSIQELADEADFTLDELIAETNTANEGTGFLPELNPQNEEEFGPGSLLGIGLSSLSDNTEAQLDEFEGLTDTPLQNSVSMSLPAVVSAIDDEMRIALTDLLKGLEKPAEIDAVTESAPQFLIFLLDGVSMAIPVANITEVSQPLPITRVPNLPNWLLGVSNLRGDIISVFDMRLYFLGQRQVIRPDSRFLVVHDTQNSVTTTLIVDSIAELQYLIADQIEKKVPTTINKRVAPFVTGTYQLFERQIAILDLDGFLSSTAFRQFEPI